MYTKKECQKYVSNLAKEIGFVFPDKHIKYRISNKDKQKRSFNEKNKIITITGIKDKQISKEKSKGMMEIALCHEFGHNVLCFILQNNIHKENIENISLDKYNKMLQTYYKNKKIIVRQTDLNVFKNYVKENVWFQKDIYDVLRFDIKYYAMVNEIEYNEYARQSNELFANYFAIKKLTEKYLNEKQRVVASKEYLDGVAYETSAVTIGIDEKKILKSKETFKKQIEIYEKINRKKGKTNEKYEDYDFEYFACYLYPYMKQLKENVKELCDKYRKEIHPDEKKWKEYEQKTKLQLEQLVNILENKKENSIRVCRIDNYEPLGCNDGNYEIMCGDYVKIKNKIEQSFLSTKIKELVVDIENQKLYMFQKPRIQTESLIYGNVVLNNCKTDTENKKESENNKKDKIKNTDDLEI